MNTIKYLQIKTWLNQNKVEHYYVEKDSLIVNVAGTVELQDRNLENFPKFITFGKIEGSFFCSHNKLESLRGSPRVVVGSFYCHSNRLTDLKGGPEVVDGGYYCSNNRLVNLVGAPKISNRLFSCAKNKLTSLVGGPEIINGDLNIMGNEKTLKSRKGLGKVTGRTLGFIWSSKS